MVELKLFYSYKRLELTLTHRIRYEMPFSGKFTIGCLQDCSEIRHNYLDTEKNF